MKKLRKDVERYSAEGVYPYLGKDYYTNRRDQKWEKPQFQRPTYSRGGNKRITFSETSGSSSEDEQGMEQTNRNVPPFERDSFLGRRQNRGQRGFRNFNREGFRSFNREEGTRNHLPQNGGQEYLVTRNKRYWR